MKRILECNDSVESEVKNQFERCNSALNSWAKSQSWSIVDGLTFRPVAEVNFHTEFAMKVWLRSEGNDKMKPVVEKEFEFYLKELQHRVNSFVEERWAKMLEAKRNTGDN